MRNLLLLAIFCFSLTGCAQNAEQAAAYRQFGAAMLGTYSTQQQSMQYAPRTCMSHPVTGAYLQCHHIMANGQCAHYGAPCL